MTSPGLSTSVCGIIGSLRGSVYSWKSRSFWTVRPGSDRKVHCAPTEARNSCSVWWSSVAIVTTVGVSHGDLGIGGGELEVLLVLLGAVVAAREREDEGIVALELTQPAGDVRVVGQLVVRERAAGEDVGAHG
jgi:hypothetical protein